MSSKPLPPFLARARIITNLDIPGMLKLILHTLNSRCNYAGRCYPSIDQIVIDAGISRTATIDNLNKLRSMGLILRFRGGSRNHHNIYDLILKYGDATVMPNVALPRATSQEGNSIPHESGRRTRESPAGGLTSPADGLVGVRQTHLSLLIKRSLEDVYEEVLANATNSEEVKDLFNHWYSIMVNSKLPTQTLITWFLTLTPISLSDGILTSYSPSQFHFDYLKEHYSDFLDEHSIILTRQVKLTLETRTPHDS
jgi:hypothetical protein